MDSLVDLNGSSFISVFPETIKRYLTASFKKALRLMMLFTLLDLPLISRDVLDRHVRVLVISLCDD